MNRPIPLVTLFLLVTFAAGVANADARPRRRDKPAPAATKDSTVPATDGDATTQPTAGECVEENQLKRCHVSGLGAVFEVSVAKGTQLMVTIDEPLKRVIPPDDRYIDYVRRKGTKDFIVYELVSDSLPDNITSSIKTASSTITLRFKVVKKDPDLQVHILHTDRAKRDALKDQCLAEYKAHDGARYRKKFKKLDEHIDRRARKRLLVQANAGDGFSVVKPRGTTKERGDFLVLRAEKVFRVGTWRLLQISLENMDRPALRIGTISAFAQTNESPSLLDADVQCDRDVIRGRKKARCVVALGALDPLPDKARIRIKATEKNGDRSVTLSGIDVR